MIHRLSGANPLELVGTTINTMDEYGLRNQPNSELGYGASAAQDGRTWKANGITCIDGVIYVAMSKHDYPWRNKQLIDMRQTAADASIIKSIDHGLHWTHSAAENYARPMFPGSRFGAPFFITYGKNGAATEDGADSYVYAVSNNGFWNNGDDLILGRVSRSAIAELSGTDWEFYKRSGSNGRLSKSWSRDIRLATPILKDPGRVGMSAVQYIEPLKAYLLCQWYYRETILTAAHHMVVSYCPGTLGTMDANVHPDLPRGIIQSRVCRKIRQRRRAPSNRLRRRRFSEERVVLQVACDANSNPPEGRQNAVNSTSRSEPVPREKMR